TESLQHARRGDQKARLHSRHARPGRVPSRQSQRRAHRIPSTLQNGRLTSECYLEQQKRRDFLSRAAFIVSFNATASGGRGKSVVPGRRDRSDRWKPCWSL